MYNIKKGIKNMKIFEAIERILHGNEVEKFKKRGGIVGKRCSFYNVDIDYGNSYLVTIGDDVTLSNCTILAHDASTDKVCGYTKFGKVSIGNNVFVGYGSVILPNVKIGNNVIIGTASVITKDIPDNSIVAGNPAKVIGDFDTFKEKYTKLFNEKPRFEVRWQDRTKKDKERMIKEIVDIGFSK